MVEVVTGRLRSLVDALVYGFAQVSSLLKREGAQTEDSAVSCQKEGGASMWYLITGKNHPSEITTWTERGPVETLQNNDAHWGEFKDAQKYTHTE